MRLNIILSLFLLLFIAFQPLAGQTLPPGPQVLTFFSDADDTEQPYGLYLPQQYDPQKKYPLVIMLHGAGSNHRLALRRVFGKSNMAGETDVEATRYFPAWKDVEYIVASPYARGTAGYQGIAEKDVYDVLNDVKRRFSIDEDRIYLTGLSMGGGGTLWIGLTRPDIWAAIAPVCPAPPHGTDLLANNAFNLSTHFFHGDQDKAVPVTVSRDWVKKLKALGANVAYEEYPGVAHNSWENAYKDGFIFTWFSQFKRNRFPDHVRFTSLNYKYDSAYWVRIDKLTPSVPASIEAKFNAVNQLDVTTSEVGAFTLRLSNHPKYAAEKPLSITINGKKIKVQSGPLLSFTLANQKWIQGKYVPHPSAKKPLAEGPIRAAFSGRHVYVYGTGGNATAEEVKNRMDIAQHAANWSAYRNAFLGRISFFPRVIADKDVRPSDLEQCDLILFGTPETNSLIQQYSGQLPMQFSGDPKTFGLFYVFPVNNHYVVINSGLPWWTGYDGQSYIATQQHAMLPGFKDYILFKDSVKNIVAEGYFDDQWQVPSEAAKNIAATGAVTLKR